MQGEDENIRDGMQAVEVNWPANAMMLLYTFTSVLVLTLLFGNQSFECIGS